MINLRERNEFLTNLFNFDNLANIYTRSQRDLTKGVKESIEDYKHSWGQIPSSDTNRLSMALSNQPDYEWLKEIDYRDYSMLIKEKSAEQIIEEFLTEAKDIGLSISDLVESAPDSEMNRKPLMAVDLETTGKDLSFRKLGGKTHHTCYITGVCLTFANPDGRETSTYIPVLNTESDGVPNVLYKTIINALSRICEEFTTTYHNSNFDREVMSMNGVKYKRIGGFFDTIVLIKQTDYMLQDFVKVGLKELSEDILERKQITLGQVDAKSKGYHNLSYSEMAIYGMSDSSNTMALIKYMAKEYSHVFESKNLNMIDARAMDVTSIINRQGFPADYEYIKNALADVTRREYVLFERFAQIMEDLGADPDVYITKTEAISRELIKIYIDNFSKYIEKKTNIKLDVYGNPEHLQKFEVALRDDLGVVIKKEYLKSSGDLKLTHSMDVNHLELIQDHIEGIRWVPSQVAEKISDLMDTLMVASSILQNKNSYYKPFIRSISYDDSGFYKIPVRLKFMGTVTTRYANASGKPTDISVEVMKTKTKYSLRVDSGLCGVNCQGIPSGQYKEFKAKKILNPSVLGVGVNKEFERIEAIVKEDMKNNLV